MKTMKLYPRYIYPRVMEALANSPVERGKIDLLCEAVLRTPSSRGINPWAFVFMTNPQTIAELSRAKPQGAAFLARAPMAVVAIGHPAEAKRLQAAAPLALDKVSFPRYGRQSAN